MNTRQLIDLLPFTDVGVGGVYPADRIPGVWTKPCAIIANTDDHTQPGSHWVAFYHDARGRGIFFDSFGLPPTDHRFVHHLRRNCSYYLYNSKRLQDMSSNLCGHYCIVVLHHLHNNGSLDSFQQLFSNNTRENDRRILKMFKKIVKKKKNKNLYKSFQLLSGDGYHFVNQSSNF